MILLEGDKEQRLGLFGEDTFDLVGTIEVSFGIKFTKDDLIQAVNIRTLADCIYKKINRPLSEKCLSAIIFYRLRRTFINLFCIPRAKITPRTSLVDLLPWSDRKRRWRELQDRMGLMLPALVWPLWLLALSVAAVGLFFSALGWKRLVSLDGFASEILLFFGAFCLWIAICMVLSPLGRKFPKGCETSADLVKLTLARNYGTISSEHGVSSEAEVLELVRKLIATEAAMDVQKVSPETLFPEGLNIY